MLSVKDTMLFVKDVAERLRVSPQCVYSLVNRGLLEHHRVGASGGRILISEQQLQTYLESTKRGRVRAEPKPAPEKSSAGGFTMLDGDRLREAWKRRSP